MGVQQEKEEGEKGNADLLSPQSSSSRRVSSSSFDELLVSPIVKKKGASSTSLAGQEFADSPQINSH